MKKIISLILVLCLCMALMTPVMAFYPETGEEANKCISVSTTMSVYENFVEDPFELYGLDFDDEYNTIAGEVVDSFHGYYIVSSDSVFTIKNTGYSDNYFIYIEREAYVKNADGKYVLSDQDLPSSTLRLTGFVTDAADGDIPGTDYYRVYLAEGEGCTYTTAYDYDMEIHYSGTSVSFDVDTLTQYIEDEDVIYRLTVYIDFLDQGYWYSSRYYKVDDAAAAEIMARGKDADIEPITVENPFTDVSADSYYYDPVRWALQNGITTGMSATSFGPQLTCTRGQVVTFLWRANGCPEPASTENPFTDVKESDYYYKPVLWALENGITTGTTATTFAPSATCTSAHVITFLWRASGEPFAVGESELADAYPGQWYSDALLWADITGLLDGPDTPFAPGNNSPRADIVTYLYRSMG